MAFPARLFGEGLDFDTVQNPWSIGLNPNAANDTIVIWLAIEGDVTGSINATNFPGWQKLGRAVSGGAVTCEVYTKQATGSETLVDVDLTAAAKGTAARIFYQDAGGATATFSTGSSANADPVSHTFYATGDFAVLTALITDGTTYPSAGPAGYTLDGISVQASVDSASIRVARNDINGSSANPGAWTQSADEWVSVTVALGDVALGAPAGAPIAPSTLTATAAGSSVINLTWADNSSNETGFQIERAPHVP